MSTYELTQEDLEEGFDDNPPSIRAARNPNPAVLSAILAEGARLRAELPSQIIRLDRPDLYYSHRAYISGALYGSYTSPLLEAVKASLPANVDVLLRDGADPNGVLFEDLDEYSVRFIRGREPKLNTYNYVPCPPRSKVMPTDTVVCPQISPLTTAEIDVRRKTFSRFWTEPHLPTIWFRGGPARTALEVAASLGDIDLFDQVRAANPDESWWTAQETPSQLPDILAHSSLSVSSPVHEAIISGKNEMLEHLLSLGYSPNIPPLAAPTCCIPPHMASIAFCDPPNIAAYNILALDPRTDLTLRTPVYSVHVLHFAAAKLDVTLLYCLSTAATTIPLRSAGCIALGHTLLHIATLPLTDLYVNLYSRKIFESVHDVRTLDTSTWSAYPLQRRKPQTPGNRQSAFDSGLLPRPGWADVEEDWTKQEAMVWWLLDSGTQDLGAKDVYGNTPLHYLASVTKVNKGLIEKLRAREGGEDVWKESRNERGYTPEELLQDGVEAEVEQWKIFWEDSASSPQTSPLIPSNTLRGRGGGRGRGRGM